MPLRAFIALCSSFILVTGLLFLGLSTDSGSYIEESHSSSVVERLKSLFAFRTPDSLFTPAATISLTDDNSTFFAARPAAFGPVLPTIGLSGQLWVGSGFEHVNHRRRYAVASMEGELGCSDIPGWSDSDWSNGSQAPNQHGTYQDSILANDQGSEDGLMLGSIQHDSNEDGTDDHLHYPLPHTAIDRESTNALLAAKSTYATLRHPNIQGRVALLSRGGCGFSEKIQWAQRRGATAVLIGDNQRGGPLIRMYARNTANITIPSLFTSHMTAHLLSSLVPNSYTAARHYQGTRDEGKPRPMKSSLPSAFHSARYGPSQGMISSSETTSGLAIESISRNSKYDGFEPEYHEGLWVTLLMADMTISPFFNTLFVLVVSPLITLAIVYVMLLVRARIRRRRWRAPKSVVERLPVRIYHAISSRTSSSSVTASSNLLHTSSSPLLVNARLDSSGGSAVAEAGASTSVLSSQYGSFDSDTSVPEKPTERPRAWNQRHGGRQVECSVCLEEYEDGISKVMSLPCGHDFHADCITPWLTTKRRTCPVCKGDVVRSMVQAGNASFGHGSAPAGLSEHEDVQVRAAETTNDAPSAALPIPAATSTDAYDFEYCERSPSPSSSDTVDDSGNPARQQSNRAASRFNNDSSPGTRRMTQSLPGRKR